MSTLNIDASTVTTNLPTRVIVTLTDANRDEVAGTADGEIVARTIAYTDSDGALALDLVPNADITPSGTYYTVHVFDHPFLIQKGSGTESLAAIAVPDAALDPFLLVLDGGDSASEFAEFDAGGS